MANDYSDYKNVQSGTAPGTIKGLLPLDGPAGGVRYRKEIFIHVDEAYFLANATYSQIITGKWKIRLLDSPGGATLFEQEVEYRVSITAISLGGFSLITWLPLDGGGGKIQTTVINGQEVDPATAWQHVDVPRPTEFSETTAYTIFTPEGVTAAGGYDFFATFYSPAYVCDIPEGGVLEREFDQWGIGTILTDATYAFSFREGAKSFAATTDDIYALRLATPQSWGLQIQHTYDGAGDLVRGAFFRGFKNPSLYKDATNRLWMAAQRGNDYGMYFSLDDGIGWRTAAIMDEEGEVVNVRIWEDGYKFQNGMIHSSGAHLQAAIKNSRVWVRSSPDGSDWSQPPLAVAPVIRNEEYRLQEMRQSGALRLVNLSGDHILECPALGGEWREI